MTANGHVRIGWRDLPAKVRTRIEEIIGGEVVEAVTQPGGFSPGTADRVRTASGARAFVKAVSPAINEFSAELARRELRITAALPPGAPVPRVLGEFDDGEWVVLVLQDIEGRQPGEPWTAGDVGIAVTALRELAAALTPSPIEDLRRTQIKMVDVFEGWERIAADPPADLDPWAADRLTSLRAAAAAGLAALRDGDTLTHGDIRGDNLLVRPDGTAIVVDWPWATVGPAWFDLALLAMHLIICGQDPAPALAGIDPGTFAAFVAGWTGYFFDMSRRPPPPGIPTVRAFQRMQGERLLPWLARYMGSAAHVAGPA